jgi:hypothetical protein
VTKWQSSSAPEEVAARAEELFANKEKAFKFMMSGET